MRLRKGVAIDLGTVSTLISVTGRGIVVEEASAIALDRETGRVAAAGDAADALAGKEPLNIEIIHPLRDGVIADLEAAAAMLQAFLRRAHLHRGMAKASAVVTVPGGATWVERRSMLAAVGALRPRFTVRLIESPVAAVAGAGFDLAAGSGAFVVNIGGGTTQAAVMAGGQLVRAQSLRLGGNAMDEAIMSTVRAELGLIIGRNAARTLKTALGLAAGAAGAEGAAGSAEAVGIDAATRTPRTVRVTGELVAAALEHTVAAMVTAVHEMLSDIPPNLAEDIVRGKIRLCGGGSLLPGLASKIESAAGIPVLVVDDPTRCVVRGAALILERGDGLASTPAA